MTRAAIQSVTFRYLPLLIFLAPVVGVNSAYVVASSLNHVPDCLTYLYGCTSISAIGRVMPQKGVFLLAMIPTALLSLLFWMHAENWFRRRHGNSDGADKTLVHTGALASFFLLIYISTLGIPGEFYTLTRKFGVLLYFGFTYIAQLLLTKRLYALGQHANRSDLISLADRLKWYCVFIMMFGLMLVPISLIEDLVYRKQLENILEWNYSFLMCGYFLLVYLAWRRHAPADEQLSTNAISATSE